jgi:hypothetical protein
VQEEDMRRTLLVIAAAALAAGLSSSVSAQTVTQADIQRLQDNVFLAERDITQATDTAAAGRLRTELQDLNEEVIYLKVKLRKEKAVARSEYLDVLDRIDSVRSRARSASTGSAPASTPAASTGARPPATANTGSEIPAGTEMDVRLQTNLNSGRAQVEDRFEATTLVDLGVGGRTVIPAGSVVRGVVTAVEPATRTNRTGRMTVSFDQVTVGGRAYPMRATVTQALESEGIRGEAGRIGAGAGVGAIIGGILGGFRGALAGILIGGGGTIAATEGEEVDLPQGTTLRVRLDSPLQIPAR